MNDESREAWREREHQQAWEAMPWFVNGTISPELGARVRAHLADCPDCGAEYETQCELQQAVLAWNEPAGVAPAEPGLRDLLERIDQGPRQDQLAPARHEPRRSRRLVGALGALVGLQFAALAMLAMQQSTRDDASFATLSQPARRADAGTLRVVPAGSMSLGQWQALLKSEGLQVVDGPNSLGAYALAPDGTQRGDASRQVARLRANPAIDLAEPIEGGR